MARGRERQGRGPKENRRGEGSREREGKKREGKKKGVREKTTSGEKEKRKRFGKLAQNIIVSVLVWI